MFVNRINEIFFLRANINFLGSQNRVPTNTVNQSVFNRMFFEQMDSNVFIRFPFFNVLFTTPLTLDLSHRQLVDTLLFVSNISVTIVFKRNSFTRNAKEWVDFVLDKITFENRQFDFDSTTRVFPLEGPKGVETIFSVKGDGLSQLKIRRSTNTSYTGETRNSSYSQN